MKQLLQTPNDTSGTNWWLLGEIELPVGPLAGDQVQSWLVETLRQLNLNPRFQEKILASARLAAERVIHSEGAIDSKQIHMRIFTPVKNPPEGQSWGFFRIEKMGDPSEGNHAPQHAIAFYLYIEGK